MCAEVISFKKKSTLAEDIAVAEGFVNSILVHESYHLFYLDATRNEINTQLELTNWGAAIERLKLCILTGVRNAPSENIREFISLCKNINNSDVANLIGVAFSFPKLDGEDEWSFMLLKQSDNAFLIRDLYHNKRRILVRA